MKQVIFGLILFTSLIFSEIDLTAYKAMAPRNIGPAGMSGRVTSIDVTGKNKDIIYVGTASGGIWRSVGGIDWEPIFDDAPIQNIGSLKIESNNSDVIWVGTGEGNPRNSISSGEGLYKSVDGGKTFQFAGLKDVRNNHRIVINQSNPDIVTVGSTGNPWTSDEHRGIYQTHDGGKSWKKILPNNEFPMNDSTGCADLIQDPSNPNKMIAAMWEHRRYPWFFTSGGKSSGIYITYDGGESWKKISKGLPKGDLGRIGLTLCETKPNYMYAYVESKKNAIYASTDGGESWEMRTNKGEFGNRPFYYADLYCDPINENRIYSIWSVLSRSEDGGKTWKVIAPYYSGGIHPDHHAFWINPDNPNHIIEGNDGGLNITYDMAKHWRFIDNIPVAQFYHINIDMDVPFNVYGGMQDNGSWQGPSKVARVGGIKNYYWEEIAFGDGFDVIPDVAANGYHYAMSQEGNLYRINENTGQQHYIKPVHPDGEKLRFHWNAAIAQDPNKPSTIYYGSQYVHKSIDFGANWEIISPDLTTNDSTKQQQANSGGLTYDVTGAENHTTILAISPSPLDPDELWVSTDDGNLQLKKSGETTWTNLSDNIKGLPNTPWIPQVNPSKYNKGECFIVVNNYRKGDWEPYIYHTKDYGKTWTNLVAGSEMNSYCLSFVQDPFEPNLMFVGTEFGLYFSLDYGKNWQKWDKDYPSVSTMDLKIHPREGSLVVGTFGRAAWIFDNISPLRHLAKSGEPKKSITTFDVQDAYLVNYRQPSGGRFTAHAQYSGDNGGFDAAIPFYINKPEKKKKDKKDTTEKEEEYKLSTDSTRITIYTKNWKEIRSWKAKVDTALNVINWNLQAYGVRSPMQKKNENADKPGGGIILPGDYNIVLEYNEQFDTTSVSVKPDPRIEYNEATWKSKIAKLDQLWKITNTATKAMDQIRDAEASIKSFASRMDKLDKDGKKTLKDLNKAAEDSLKIAKNLMRYDMGKKQGIVRRPDKLAENLGTASYYIYSAVDAPTSTADFMIKKCQKQLDEFLEAHNKFFSEDWKKYKEEVSKLKFKYFEDAEIINGE